MVNTTNWYGASWADGERSSTRRPGATPSTLIARPGAAPASSRGSSRRRTNTRTSARSSCPAAKWVLYHVWHGSEECSIHATEHATGAEHVVIAQRHDAPASRRRRAGRLPALRARQHHLRRAVRPRDGDGDRRRAGDRRRRHERRHPLRRLLRRRQRRHARLHPRRGASRRRAASRTSTTDGTAQPFNDERLSFAEPRFSLDGSKLAVALKGKLYQAIVYDLERQDASRPADGRRHRRATCSARTASRWRARSTATADTAIDLHRPSPTARRAAITPPGADYQSDLDWSNDGRYITFACRRAEARRATCGASRPAATDETPKPVIATAGADVQAGHLAGREVDLRTPPTSPAGRRSTSPPSPPATASARSRPAAASSRCGRRTASSLLHRAARARRQVGISADGGRRRADRPSSTTSPSANPTRSPATTRSPRRPAVHRRTLRAPPGRDAPVRRHELVPIAQVTARRPHACRVRLAYAGSSATLFPRRVRIRWSHRWRGRIGSSPGCSTGCSRRW